MAGKRSTELERDIAFSDEAAAYIADALMQLALDFENSHYDQIRRHLQAMPERGDDPAQLELFPEHSSSPFDRRHDF